MNVKQCEEDTNEGGSAPDASQNYSKQRCQSANESLGMYSETLTDRYHNRARIDNHPGSPIQMETLPSASRQNNYTQQDETLNDIKSEILEETTTGVPTFETTN